MYRLLALLILLGQCASSYASLGAAPSDFSNDQARIKPRVLARANNSYQVNESTLPGGTLVREYVTPGGLVFAVSWSGPFLPDLRNLLGKHFTTLSDEAAKSPKAGHSQLQLARPDIVIESGGHMRAYVGRAWIPSAFPSGVTPDNIE